MVKKTNDNASSNNTAIINSNNHNNHKNYNKNNCGYNMKYLYINKYWELNKEYNLDKLLYLMVDRPNVVYKLNFIWLNDKNQNHRDYDLPSEIDIIDTTHISLYWDINGKWHRKNNKPAFISYDGHKEYYIYDVFIKKTITTINH